MKDKKKVIIESREGDKHLSRIQREVLSLLLFFVGLFILMSLWMLGGALGAMVKHLFELLLGWFAWLPAALLFGCAWWLARGHEKESGPRITLVVGSCLIVVSLMLSASASMRYWPMERVIAEGRSGAGLVGWMMAHVLTIGVGESYWLVVFMCIVIGLVLVFQKPIHHWWQSIWSIFSKERRRSSSPSSRGDFQRSVLDDASEQQEEQELSDNDKGDHQDETPFRAPERLAVDVSAKRAKSQRVSSAHPPTFDVTLMEGGGDKPQSGDQEQAKRVIHDTFEQFGITVDMEDVHVGPTVTQYTLKPAAGVKLAQITALHNDLALSLAAHPIRIEAPIPGKSLVGIEVPNRRIATVALKELLSSEEFRQKRLNSPDRLWICLGRDVSGIPQLAALDAMPHLLIAGATGSGKTVALNTLIVSLLYQKLPSELQLLLIDPKRVELTQYNGIPYLVSPVMTDVRKIIAALKWVLREMDRRFDMLAGASKRDIASFNRDADTPLPYLVVVIDELADLMVVSSSEVEASIIRLAQMARAVGIHLVVATQRPSVDVLTGLIKANITSRMAFSVASSIDSRTILDTPGAEKLLGRGDMLFVSSEMSKPRRIQGGHVSDKDIQHIVDHLKSLGDPHYEDVATNDHAGALAGVGLDGGDGDDDPLLPEAIDVIQRDKKASASLLQRRLKVGYARAARLLDLLEARGLIGPQDGAKPRAILMGSGGDDTLTKDSFDDEPYDDDSDDTMDHDQSFDDAR